jgi:PQQ-like domain
MRAALFVLFASALYAQPTISTTQTDYSRQAVVQETILTPANVALPSFGKMGTIPLAGRPYSQVLYIPAITVSGKSRNVIFVTDSTNTAYAFDADTLAPLWKNITGETPCTSVCTSIQIGPYGLNYNNTVGIFGTPGIDVTNNWLFLVTYSESQIYKLWKLNLLTGASIGSPLTLTASVSPSTASEAVGGTLTFNPQLVQQRTAVTVANGNVYVTFGSLRDTAPWHGWIMARKETDLSVIGNFCTNRNQTGGGLWMASSGPSIDASGNLYMVTGNGGTTTPTYTSSYDGVTEFSMSILKLSPTLTLLDWYTPANYATQNANDTDLGSSHPMLIPNPASAGNYLIVTGGKDYNVYSVHSECMGHLGGTVGGCPGAQVFATGTDSGQHLGIYGDAFMNSTAYFPNTAGLVYSFALNNTGLFTTTPTTGSSTSFPGAMLSGSINGTSNGIMWAITTNSSTLTSPAAGQLVALNPTTLATIWSSATTFGDSMGEVAKFISPTVANGKVYVPGYDGFIYAYGVRNPSSGTYLGGSVTMGGSVAQN